LVIVRWLTETFNTVFVKIISLVAAIEPTPTSKIGFHGGVDGCFHLWIFVSTATVVVAVASVTLTTFSKTFITVLELIWFVGRSNPTRK